MIQMTNWHQNLKHYLTLGLSLSLITFVTEAKALEVEITPSNPQLGDTISVIVEVDDPNTAPTVTMKGTAYEAFPQSNSHSDAPTYRALLPTSPLDKPGSIPIQVSGDGETQNFNLNLRNRSFPTQRITLSGGGDDATQTELDQVATFKALVTPEKFWQGAFLRPNSAGVSTEYGIRRYYNGVFAEDYYHRGVDYAGGYGSAVVAPAAGRVRLIGRESQGFRVHGNTVGIDHGQGVVSIFLHLSRIDVKEGDFVQAGQQIGAVGSTGASTGPHLHWGLYVHGVAVDPVPWRFGGIE
jgi:murein DD-endopeptidase MepM/ murein hydrolase activator NlpD